MWQVRLKSQGVSCIVSKCCELWSTNGIKVDRSFYTPSVNSAFCFIARLRRRRSANGTQPNFAKRWTVNCRGRPFQEMGSKNFYICSIFDNSRDLMVNIFCLSIDNWIWALEIEGVPYIVPQFHEPWFTNG